MEVWTMEDKPVIDPKADIKARFAKIAQKKKEVAEKVDTSVTAFFEEQAEKRANYVQQPLIIKQLPVGLYTIHFKDSGPTPTMLSGTYTTMHQAEKAIASYLRAR